MSDVEYALNLIRDCWPDFPITKENLLHPTPELVLRFYSCFVNEYNDTVRYLTGVSIPNEIISPDLEPEERLFQQLSKLLQMHSVKFTLSDIYAPVPLRTKTFFKLCTHFIVFSQHVSSDKDITENIVFKTKDEISKLLIEQEELSNEINENARNKELHERNKDLLEQEYKSTKNSYEKMKELKANKEKLCAEKRQQIETLKWEMQNEECELKSLETVEKDLLQQRITEKDYHNILQTVETLKAESEMYDSDDVNIDDGLVHENEVLKHSADCLRILNQFDFNVQNVKNLIKKEEQLKTISNTLEKLKGKLNFIKVQNPEGEKKVLLLQDSFVALQTKSKDIKEQYLLGIRQFSQEEARLKTEIQEKSESNTKIVMMHKKDIRKLEEDLEKLKKNFTDQYIRVSKVESRVVDNFRDILMKCNKSP